MYLYIILYRSEAHLWRQTWNRSTVPDSVDPTIRPSKTEPQRDRDSSRSCSARRFAASVKRQAGDVNSPNMSHSVSGTWYTYPEMSEHVHVKDLPYLLRRVVQESVARHDACIVYENRHVPDVLPHVFSHADYLIPVRHVTSGTESANLC